MAAADQWNNRVFFNTQRVCSDACAMEAKDNQNDEISDYQLYRYLPVPCEAPEPRYPKWSYDHVNLHGRIGYGQSDGCDIDSFSELRNDPNQLTHDRCKIQLFTRLFTGCPNLTPGVPNPDIELPILQGSSSDDLTGPQGDCKRSMVDEKSIQDWWPLIPCVASAQDPKHIVEPWTRGGVDTRDFVRQSEWLSRCGAIGPRNQVKGQIY